MSDAPRPKIAPAEWAVAALGVLLFLAVVAVLGRSALDGPERPPAVRVSVASVEPTAGGWTVHVRARNDGDETAADLTIRGTVADSVEREVTLDYLPGHSTRDAGLVFPSDPRGRLRLEAIGFREP